jgi:hypothetical protein
MAHAAGAASCAPPPLALALAPPGLLSSSCRACLNEATGAPACGPPQAPSTLKVMEVASGESRRMPAAGIELHSSR